MTLLNELGLPLEDLSPKDHKLFQSLYEARRKHSSTGVILACFTPALHHVYYGQWAAWLFYLMLLGASIPVFLFWVVPIIWIIEGLCCSGMYAKRHNIAIGADLFMKIRAMQPIQQEAVETGPTPL